jgi:hypothetical protein
MVVCPLLIEGKFERIFSLFASVALNAAGQSPVRRPRPRLRRQATNRHLLDITYTAVASADNSVRRSLPLGHHAFQFVDARFIGLGVTATGKALLPRYLAGHFFQHRLVPQKRKNHRQQYQAEGQPIPVSSLRLRNNTTSNRGPSILLSHFDQNAASLSLRVRG